MFRNVVKKSILLIRLDVSSCSLHSQANQNYNYNYNRFLTTSGNAKQLLSVQTTSNDLDPSMTPKCNSSTSSSTNHSSSNSDHDDEKYDEVTVQYVRGLPQVIVPLPSRKEKCKFILKPVSNTVGEFMNMVRNEDKGIEQINVYSIDNVRIASSNNIESLLDDNFKLRINDVTYFVFVPKRNKITTEQMDTLSDIRNLVNQLYECLNVKEHFVRQERDLYLRLETVKQNLEPLEQTMLIINESATKKTSYLAWAGLGLMSVQFGVLARLTWWEYSWDIMEPITYFVTYGTAMACYAYFVLTKEDYVLPEVRNRQHLIALHKKARKTGLDFAKYNQLKEEILMLENELKMLQSKYHRSIALPCQHFGDSKTRSDICKKPNHISLQTR